MKTPTLDLIEDKYDLNLEHNVDFFTKENHWLPKKIGVQYLALGKTLYSDRTIETIPDHEFLHIAQFRKYRIPGVLVHYLFHFAKNYFSCFDLGQSFKNIPFEVEAREFEKSKKG